MRCNWCGKGDGKNYTTNKEGDKYWYYCKDCLGEINKELKGAEEK